MVSRLVSPLHSSDLGECKAWLRLWGPRKKEIGRARNLLTDWKLDQIRSISSHLPADPRSPPVPNSLFQLHFAC